MRGLHGRTEFAGFGAGRAAQRRRRGWQDGAQAPGQWETVQAPDTLDLAERGRMALNYYFYNHEPEQGWSLYHICKFDVDPPVVIQLTWNLPIKEVRGFPWLRTMTGSEERLDIEARS